jgi:hypothetical protein
MHLGPDGTGAGLTIEIFWGDLETACVAILGYSKRDPGDPVNGVPPSLKRYVPWQHPYFNQLWARAITSVRGVRMEGNSFLDPEDLFFPRMGGAGQGIPINAGPWTEYRLALITISFWRPPYYIRSDQDVRITMPDGITVRQAEWKRYVDRNWSVSASMLSREGQMFQWSSSTGAINHNQGGFPGSRGQQLMNCRITRRWAQVPEQCLFAPIDDGTPNGLPTNQVYNRTATVNPITGYVYGGGSTLALTSNQSTGMPAIGCVNVPIGTGFIRYTGDTVAGSPVVKNLSPGNATTKLAAGDAVVVTDGIIYGFPTGTCILSVDSPTQITLTQNALNTRTATLVNAVCDHDPTLRFFGCPMGTLLFLGVEYQDRPLQLPAYLMEIPAFSSNEPLSQVQYDVVFHFMLFDPPRAATEPLRGHNLMPYSGNGLWYPARTQFNDANPPVQGVPYLQTPFHYIDFADLFVVL